MKLPQQVIDVLLNADGKALATRSDQGVNVVPVSMVKMKEDAIWLFNCFMGKTVENISKEPHTSLACWKGKDGYQIRASATYLTEGDAFEEARRFVAETAPNRVVKGLLILEPLEVYDVSPSLERAGMRLV